jgi:hypothetical protein
LAQPVVRQVLELYFLPLEAQTVLLELVALVVRVLLRLHCVTHLRLPVVRVVHLLVGLPEVVVVVHPMELVGLAALLLVPVRVAEAGAALEEQILQAPVGAVVGCLLVVQQAVVPIRMAVAEGLLVLVERLPMELAGMVVRDHLLVVVEALERFLLRTMALERVLYLTFHQDRCPAAAVEEAVTQRLLAVAMVALAVAVAAVRGKAVREVSVEAAVEVD